MTWKEKYNKKYGYPKDKSHSLSDIAKDTGINERGLQKIYNKGVGAWKTNIGSVRLKKDFTKNKNTSKYPRKTRLGKEQWAMARVYSAVMGGNASKVDKKELQMEKGGNLKNDKVTMDVPLLIRMLEYAKEDAKDDVELHKISERLITLSQNKTLTMDDYHKIISEYKNGGQTEDLDWEDYYEMGGLVNNSMSLEMKERLFDENGKAKIDLESIKVLTDYINTLPQTKSMYFNEATGKYTPKRQALHKEIIDEFKEGLFCIENDEPIAILMGGSPASGKSTFLKKYAPYLLSEELLKIDADEVRAKLPEYEGWNASQTHSETKDIVKTLLSDRVIGVPCKTDLIYDGTMTSVSKYISLIKLLKKLGYKIFVVFIDNVPKDVIVERALKRYQSSGRFVPLEVIDDFFQKGRSSLNEVKKEVDGYMVVDGGSGDYNIIEQGGIKLPQNRVYSKIGQPLSEYDRNKFYEGYYKNLSPSFADVKRKGGKIEIDIEKGGAIDTNEPLDAVDTVMFKKGGQTDFNPDGAIKDKIVHSSGKVGGMLVGKRHSEGGIQAVNKSTGQPLEMEGGEVVITRDAVTDPQKRMFNGKYMTNREILSEINVSGGGVAFADGGEVPNTIAFSDSANFEFGGKTMCGCDIAKRLSNGGNFDYVYKNGGIVSEADFPNSLSDATFVKDLGGSTGAKLYEYKGKQFVAKKGANKDHAKEERLANALYNRMRIDVPLFDFIDGDTLVKQYIEDVRNVNWNDETEAKKVLKGYVVDALLSNWDVYKNDNILIEKSTGTPYRIDNGGALRYRAQGGIKYNFNETVDEIKTLADSNPQIKKYITPEMIREQIDYIVTNSFGILNAVRLEMELRDVLDKRIEYLANNKEELANHFKSSSEETVEEVIEIEAPKEKTFEETFLENKIQDLRKKYALKKAYMSEIEKGLALREIRKFENKLDEIRLDKKSFEEILNDFVGGAQLDFGDINAERKPSGKKSINGKKSELTKEESRIVNSESFINWFGDWELAFETGNYEGVSKIINQETKEPLVVYHGTDTKFTSWETYSSNNLHYFAKKKEFADWFATAWQMRTDTAGVQSEQIKSDNPIKGEYVYACFLDIKNPIDLSPFGVEKHPFNKYLEYLSVKYDIDLKKIEGYEGLKDKTTPVYSWVVIRTWQKFNLHIKNNTPYDGFIFFEYIPEKPKTGFQNASLCFTAFESNQIKFANNKTFTKQANDSRLEIGGIVF